MPVSETFRPCVIIPTYNHWQVLPKILAEVRSRGLAIYIIDDGSDSPCAEAVKALHDEASQIIVSRHEPNRGKGFAVMQGFELASKAGFTHALQIDADGQHDLAKIDTFLATARRQPDAVISGQPVYDTSIPTGRKIGRWITHIWVFIETLSLRITDSMCGFRVYPLEQVMALKAQESIGSRMDFDVEIMVRLFWRGVAPVMIPVKVTYPPGNISNFRLWRDNALISLMHTRLVFTMIWRLPSILANRPPPQEAPQHWADINERGIFAGIQGAAIVARLLGRGFCIAFLAPAVLYFWITGSKQRAASRHYLEQIRNQPASALDTLRHFFDFSTRAIDVFRAWTGSLPKGCLSIDAPDMLRQAMEEKRGAVIIVSHHGNAEISRALLPPDLQARLTILVHTRHAEKYNQLITAYSRQDLTSILQVTEMGPETAIMLRERIEAGEWIAIAGDRIPVSATGRTVQVDFLGRPAHFSQGPWLLASLLDCPVYMLFCSRTAKDHWLLSFEKLTDRIVLSRPGRLNDIENYAGLYAKRLETECRRAPFQWYNFFDFWKNEDKS